MVPTTSAIDHTADPGSIVGRGGATRARPGCPRLRQKAPLAPRRHPFLFARKSAVHSGYPHFRIFLSVKIDSNHPIRVGAGFFGIYANATRHHRARGCHARQLLRMQDSRSCPGSATLPIAAAGVSDLNFCTILKRVIGQTEPPPSIYGHKPAGESATQADGCHETGDRESVRLQQHSISESSWCDAPDA